MIRAQEDRACLKEHGNATLEKKPEEKNVGERTKGIEAAQAALGQAKHARKVMAAGLERARAY